MCYIFIVTEKAGVYMRIEKERVFEMVRRPAFWQFLCMMAGGGVSVMAANTWDKPYFVEIPI